jgi:hypothetical protein
MPSTKWFSFFGIQPDHEYLVLLTYLPLKHWSKLPAFLRYVLAIQKQLKSTKGVIGYSLLAHPFSRDFWALSVWEDAQSLSEFVRAKPHAQVMSRLRGHMGATKFIQWRDLGSVLPPSWAEAMERFQAERRILEDDA